MADELEKALQMEVMVSAAVAQAYDGVCKLLEREAEKMKDCGDKQTADYVDMLRARVKALAAGRST